MTREEHISNLETIGCDGWTVTTDAYKSLQFAIQALEQEKPETVTEFADRCRECGAKYGKLLRQEPCEDAISRQAVEKITWEEPSYTDALNVLTEVRDKVRALPSINPRSKTGHWIYDDECCEHGHCSECGYGSVDLLGGELWRYCPSCGARMVEPQESENE